MPYYLLLPFAAAFVFALASIFFKRAFAEGAGMARTFFVTSVLTGLLLLPVLWCDRRPVQWDQWHVPFLTGLAFFLGHLANFLALRTGDVSLATPLLGAKVLFVVLFSSVFFGLELRVEHGWAAVLTAAGVFLLGSTDTRPGKAAFRTIVFALTSGACFALCDLSIQRWAGSFGIFHLLPLTFLVVAGLSAGFVPFFRAPLRAIPRSAWRWIFGAAALTAVQGVLITGAVGLFHDATGINVVYGTRGLWSIALVWFVGERLGNQERQTARTQMPRRVLGALLMMGAVVLAVKAAQAK